MTIDEIKKIITPLVTPYPVVSRVILFGSYARGEQTDNSDIDLVIDSNNTLSYWDLLGLSGDIIRKMPIKADVWGLEELKKPALLANIANEGVLIYEK
jgi:predicted nucleotidyltransferase